MITFKAEEVKVVRTQGDKLFCDVCNKEINSNRFYLVTTGHYDWGRDSMDSVKRFHICEKNPICLASMFERYSDKTNGKNNTEYLEINHRSTKEVLENAEEDNDW